ncbi:PRC-barrel domain-containing protein [Alkalihalobacillus sp. AL-G]|uniref:PRC-barrel domain-containing protein n=1 Tax=Alkalihalobacillus sp. AL-G TaxID=2926399 RepID=UPI00272CECDF|nr:PRC-barrel domain-containing protein [Alkalihalobacillus sp. AL-G]WLD92436.1 PRC-barrel domain-containing protein [Alkalihalobacillus sp. AL-G]
MLIVGKDLLDKTIGYKDSGDLTDHTVEDILLEKDTYVLDYILYVEKRPSEGNEKQRVEPSMMNVVGSTGGQTAMNTPPVTSDDSFTKDYREDIFYVPFSHVEEILNDKVLITGIDQQLHDPVESIAVTGLIDRKVKTASGDSLGKVKDIVIDWDIKRVVGLSLAEGFWARMMSEENKYMPLEGTMDWTVDEIIVSNHLKDRLVEDVQNVRM